MNPFAWLEQTSLAAWIGQSTSFFACGRVRATLVVWRRILGHHAPVPAVLGQEKDVRAAFQLDRQSGVLCAF
jgi:hypothetical protein